MNTFKAQLDFFCSEETDRYCVVIETNLSVNELISKMMKWNEKLNEEEIYDEEGFNCNTLLSYLKHDDPELKWTILLDLTFAEEPISFSFYDCILEMRLE